MKCPECGEDLAFVDKCIVSKLYAVSDEGVVEDNPFDNLSGKIIKSSVHCLNPKCAKEFKHRIDVESFMKEGKLKLSTDF